MILTEGVRFSGYRLYLLKGEPVLLYNYLDLRRLCWEERLRLALENALSCSTSSITAEAFSMRVAAFGSGHQWNNGITC